MTETEPRPKNAISIKKHKGAKEGDMPTQRTITQLPAFNQKPTSAVGNGIKKEPQPTSKTISELPKKKTTPSKTGNESEKNELLRKEEVANPTNQITTNLPTVKKPPPKSPKKVVTWEVEDVAPRRVVTSKIPDNKTPAKSGGRSKKPEEKDKRKFDSDLDDYWNL